MKPRKIPYVGNGPYCYANATSMLLGSIQETVSPSLVEVLTGVGLGAFWVPRRKQVIFSSIANAPDLGISKALEILGFEFREHAEQEAGSPPFDQLGKDLETAPAILGPLDMGFLSHNPVHKYLAGADHFVLAYAIDSESVHFHDPEGFPHVSLPLKEFELAWRAEKIEYRRGCYRYWSLPRRIHRPSENEVYYQALEFFKTVYRESEKMAKGEKWVVDHDAIRKLADFVGEARLSPSQTGFMVHFAFKLGARRAMDFADFLEPKDPELASLKHMQAELFGRAHTAASQKKWSSLAQTLRELARAEEEFRFKLLKSEVQIPQHVHSTS